MRGSLPNRQLRLVLAWTELFSVVARTRKVSPGESIPPIDVKENGGYTVEACELDSCPHLLFPQIQTALIYTNKYRYQDDTLLGDELRHFYLPMLFDPETNRCLAISVFLLARVHRDVT